MNRKTFTSIIATACHLVCALSFAACSPKPAAKSASEIPGTQADRVATISKMITRHTPLPSPLIDAHFVEEQIGDGVLGPSDFKSFYALTVAAADLPAWKTELAKVKVWNRFSNDHEIKRAAPTKAQPWWVNADDVGKLEFYSPHSLTKEPNGWVGIAPDGRIFVYTFTM